MTAVSQAADAPAVGDAVPAVGAEPREQPVARDTGRSARSVARAYAQLVINWEWNTLLRQLERATALATGALRTELARTAASARADASLARDRLGSRGHVLSVSARGLGAERRLVVATEEESLRAGRAPLEGPRAQVYTGTARLTGDGWRLTVWERRP